jgi:sensor histidine kinase YesM
MKKILAIIAAMLITMQLFSIDEPKWKNEKDYFDFFNKRYVSKQACTFQDDIKIQLKGDFSKADSANMQNLVATLRPMMQRAKIYFVNKDGNAIIEIHNNGKRLIDKYIANFINRTDVDLDYKYFCQNIGEINGQYQSYTASFGNGFKNKIVKYSCSIKFYPDCPQELRNKFLTNYFIEHLIIVERAHPTKIELKSNNSWFKSFIGDSTSTKSFNELDKYIIYHSYLKWPTLHVLMKHPEHYYKFVSDYWGNYYYVFVYSFAFLIIVIYILILFRLGIVQRAIKTWIGFMIKGMLILQSALILSILYLIFSGPILKFSISHLWHILYSMFFFNTNLFVSLNLVYFLEKWLIKKQVKLANKLIIQLFTTILPFCIYLIIWNINSQIYLLFYAVIFVIIRIGYNYLYYQSQEMIMQKDVELAHMRELQHKIELQALHSRINPHFLYNALNSIAGMAKTDPPKTEHMALALSDFCRYAINKQDETFANVEEEVTIAATYLEIEKTRFGEKLQYSIEVADDCKAVTIPRFIIQPLLENAVKHGVSKITEMGIIKLKINTHNDTLVISVTDNGPTFPQLLTTGYGLQSIHDKLEILYQGAARLNWEQEPEKKISIFIPLSTAKPKQE